MPRRRLSFHISIALTLASLLGCFPSDEETRFTAQRALLQRQVQGLGQLAVEVERGALLPPGHFVVGVSEELAADVLRTQLPMERELGDRFVVRLESAEMRFRDRFGEVRIVGTIHWKRAPRHRWALRITGGLGSAKLKPDTGKIQLSIAIDDVQVLGTKGLERVFSSSAARYLGGKGRQALTSALPPLEIPVQFETALSLPAIEKEEVGLGHVKVPIEASVDGLVAANQKLWVIFKAEIGPVEGADGGLRIDVHARPGPPAGRKGP
jgi:hypothetical protein